MRNSFKFMLVMLVAGMVMAFSGGPSKYRPITWNTNSATTTIIAAAGDTSDVFVATNIFLKNGYGNGRERRVPESFSWIFYGTEGTNTDSTNATFFVDWSNDQVIWSVDTIGSILASDGTTTIGSLRMTDMPSAQYGRVRVFGAMAAGDTLTVGLTALKVYTE